MPAVDRPSSPDENIQQSHRTFNTVLKFSLTLPLLACLPSYNQITTVSHVERKKTSAKIMRGVNQLITRVGCNSLETEPNAGISCDVGAAGLTCTDR